jgi:hypothetical protein
VRAWAGSAKAGRCGYCRQAVMWLTSDAGKQLPFELGFAVRETVTDPRNGGRYLVLNKTDRHRCRSGSVRGQKANTRSHRRRS